MEPGKEEAYQRLKIKILELSESHLNLTQMKNDFRKHIDSNRAFSKVKDTKDLLDVLEKRDILNCENIYVLEYIANQVQVTEIFELLSVYKKLYDMDITCLCGMPISIENERLVPVENSFSTSVFVPEPNTYHHNDNDNNNENTDLDTAIEILAQRLGQKWRALASELDVIEFHVDQIRSSFPNDYAQQARAMLRIWKESNRQKASVDSLDEALESRHCKRKGLGSHLRQPILGLTY